MNDIRIDIATNLEKVRARVRAAAAQAGREEDAVQLLAVSKTRPLDDVLAAVAAGQGAFGENQLQDAQPKVDGTSDLDLDWHFIGPVQSNKTRPIAAQFDWVHSVDRLKIAERLSEQRPAGLSPLNVCLQFNVSGEDSKSGVTADALPALADAVAALPHLQLRGLMAIPAPTTDPAQQRAAFAQVRMAYDDLVRRGLPLDTLSMGMTDDMEAAIAEGSTMVRIGTAIFGPRRPRT